MPDSLVCPQVQQVERLRRGELALAEVEQLAQHVELCRLCAKLIVPLKHLLLSSSADTGAAPTFVTPTPSGDFFPQEAVFNTEARDIALAPAQAPDEIGRLGAYRVLKVLGSGGMGVVFQAEDPLLKRIVALKAMKPSLAASASASKRFLLEAQAIAAIKHDHIVTIYQVTQDRDVPFFVMEHLEGENLAAHLHRQQQLPLTEALRIGREIALGLAAAHKRGVIHRDIKPNNIWLESETGRVKILDFGLARAVGSESDLTQSGVIVGTPAYMAPEQARGTAVDHRCDLFSLGCVLYRMTTGKAPFAGKDTLSMLFALATDHPQPPRRLRPDMPPALNNLILRLLAKNVPDRPSSALAVVKAIEAIEHAPKPKGSETITADHSPALPACVTTADGSETITVEKTPALSLPARRTRFLFAAAAAAILVMGIIPFVTHKDGPKEIEIDDDLAKETLKVDPKQRPALPTAASPFDRLDPGDIPASERFDWQPKELVAVLGTHQHRHWRNVSVAFFTPDGKSLVSGTEQTIRVWDAAGGQEQRSFKTGNAIPHPFSLSSDGRTFAVGFGTPHTVLYDLPSGRPRRTVPVGGYCCANSSNGRLLAIGQDSSPAAAAEILITEPITEKRVTALKGHKNEIHGLAFSPDDRLLASASRDGSVKVWDTATWKEKATLPASADCVAFSPDGKWLAFVRAKEIVLWDVATEQLRGALAVPYHTDVACFTFAPDGRSLAARVDYNSKVCLWDIATRKIRVIFAAAGPSVGTCYPIAYSPDSQLLAMPNGPQVQLRDARIGDELFTLKPHKGSVPAAVYSPDGQKLATAGADRTVKLWNAQTGAILRALDGHTDEVLAIAWYPDGKTLASGGRDGSIKLWDAVAGKAKWSKEGHLGWVHALAFAPDGSTLASASKLGEVKLWDAATGALRLTLDCHEGAARALVFAPDGRTFATCGEDKTARLWDAATGKEVGVFKGHTAAVTYVAFSPDGKSLATASEDVTLRFWDIATQAEKARRGNFDSIDQMRFPLRCLAFAPDGNVLAAASEDGLVRLWRIEREEPWIALPGHEGPVLSVVFSPDGQTILSAGQDGTVRARRAPREVPNWPSPRGDTRVAAVAPDGQSLILNREGRFRIWGVAAGRVRFSSLALGSTNVDQCRLAPDGRLFAFAGSWGGRLWDFQTNKEGAFHYTSVLDFAPDGATLALYDGVTVALLDTATGAERFTIPDMGDLMAYGFGPDSKTFFTANPKVGQVKEWDVASGKPKRTLGINVLRGMYGFYAAVSPDGKTLVHFSGEAPGKIWDIEADKQLAALSFPYYRAAYSGDGKTLLLVRPKGDGHLLELYEAHQGKLRKTLRGHTERISLTVFSPDNKQLVTCGEEGRVILWDVASGEKLHPAWNLPAAPESVLFSPDGRHLICNNPNQTVYILRLASPAGMAKQ